MILIKNYNCLDTKITVPYTLNSKKIISVFQMHVLFLLNLILTIILYKLLTLIGTVLPQSRLMMSCMGSVLKWLAGWSSSHCISHLPITAALQRCHRGTKAMWQPLYCPKMSAQDIAFITFDDKFVEILHTPFKRVFSICLKWAPLRYECM